MRAHPTQCIRKCSVCGEWEVLVPGVTIEWRCQLVLIAEEHYTYFCHPNDEAEIKGR